MVDANGFWLRARPTKTKIKENSAGLKNGGEKEFSPPTRMTSPPCSPDYPYKEQLAATDPPRLDKLCACIIQSLDGEATVAQAYMPEVANGGRSDESLPPQALGGGTGPWLQVTPFVKRVRCLHGGCLSVNAGRFAAILGLKRQPYRSDVGHPLT
ncbi:hypothetical protein MRX96_058577 [Rhipicephalus microplus]